MIKDNIYCNSFAKSNNQRFSFKNNTNISIFAVNDLHGKNKFEQISNEASNFREARPESDNFVLSCGDTVVGKNPEMRKVATLAQGKVFDTGALGNHEFDAGVEQLAEEIAEWDDDARKHFGVPTRFKYVATNLVVDDDSPLKPYYSPKTILMRDKMPHTRKQMQVKIAPSLVIERNGHRHGFIGAVPAEPKEKSESFANNGMHSLDAEKTRARMQEEADKLWGVYDVESVTCIPHTGIYPALNLAQDSSGIDFITAGHTHDSCNRVLKNKDGNPVFVSEAGRNGTHAVVVDAEVDNGIKKINSMIRRIPELNGEHKDVSIRKMQDSVMGKERVIGELSEDCNPIGRKDCENPYASFIADSLIKASRNTPADLVLLTNNHDLVHEGLSAGTVTDREIKYLSPFRSPVYETELNGREVLEILNWGAESLSYKTGEHKGEIKDHKKVKPGLIQGSVNYQVNPSENPTVQSDINPEETYRVLLDEYLIKSAEYSEKNRVNKKISPIFSRHKLTKFPVDKEQAVIDNISSIGKPFSIQEETPKRILASL